MTDIFGDGEGFIDINEAMGVKSSASLNREFKPWHKPRKQLIRDWQWWEHIERLINDTSYSAIKYFGLPGGDLLDLEYFSKKLSETEKTKDTILFAYGFVNNESTKRQAEERLSKLLDKENVCDRSKIDKFSFQSISTEGSESRARLIENSPYHFFNIDLCNNIISKDYIDALRTLLTVQSRQAQSLTWLLSITTRNNGSSLQSNAYCILKAIAKNIDEEVIEKIQELFTEAHTLINNLIEMEEEVKDDSKAFSDVFNILFILWLFTYLTTYQKGKLVSSMNYTVNNDFPDLSSFVFRVEQGFELNQDPTEATSITISTQDKNVVLIDALEKFSTTMDVDQHLSENVGDFNKFLDEMKKLLKTCGYDISGYEAFARN